MANISDALRSPYVRARFLFLAAVALTATLAACESGSGYTPAPRPSLYPTSATATATVGSSAATIDLTGISTGTANIMSSATIGFPATLSGSGTLSVTLSDSASGVPTPSNGKRAATGLPSVHIESLGGANLTPIAYITTDVSSSVTLATTPSFTFDLSSAPSANLYLAMYSSTNGWEEYAGPASVSGTTATFAATPITPPITLAAQTPYVFALVSSTAALTTPAPNLNYVYSGTLTQSETFTYPTPSPLPSTSSSASISETVTFGASPAPNASGAVDVHAVAVANGALSSSTTTSDTWVGTSGSALVEYATQSNDGVSPTPDTYETLFASPAQIDTVPEAKGSWTNSAAQTIDESDADGTTDSRVVASNGTYTDTETIPSGYTVLTNDNADGSGLITGTLFTDDFGIVGFTFGAPSGGTIPVDVEYSATSSASDGTPTAWFSSPPTLSAETDTETTGVTYPAGCSVPSIEGTSGNSIVQQISTLDPIFGETDVRTNTTYTSPSYGPVCIVMNDVQTYYYDYTGDTQQSYYDFATFAGTVLSTITTSETLTLQSANGNTVQVFAAKRSASGGLTTPDAMSLHAAVSQFNGFLANNRMKRLAAMRKAIARYAATHGGKVIK